MRMVNVPIRAMTLLVVTYTGTSVAFAIPMASTRAELPKIQIVTKKMQKTRKALHYCNTAVSKSIMLVKKSGSCMFTTL